MPNLMTHIKVAIDTISTLDDPYIASNKGAFILGSVSPDIRAITKWTREYTHFVPLNVTKIGSGTETMFREHPKLIDGLSPSTPTKAFIAGYISHLTLDETWITKVYRPYLGDIDSFSTPVAATIADRSIQLDVDRMARSYLNNKVNLLKILGNSESNIKIKFIPPKLLTEWRTWVETYIQQPFSWKRLHFLVRRSHKQDETAQKQVELFLKQLDVNLSQVYARLPSDCIGLFSQESIAHAMRLIRRYLY